MLLVKTKIGPSKIHGIGLFADEFIQKGQIIWEFTKGLDIIIKKKRLSQLPKVVQKTILHYCYYNKKKQEYIICLDNARYLNHSLLSNLNEINPIKTIARRDIRPGEELTVNYFEYDGDAKRKLTSSIKFK